MLDISVIFAVKVLEWVENKQLLLSNGLPYEGGLTNNIHGLPKSRLATGFFNNSTIVSVNRQS
jgi:hypothetical protein